MVYWLSNLFFFIYKTSNKDMVIKRGLQTIRHNYILINNKGKKLAESGHVNLVTEVKSTNMFSVITASIVTR